MKTFKYRYEPWGITLSSHRGKDQVGTIRTVPENYYVADVFADLSIKFDPTTEAMTRDVDRASVTKWWKDQMIKKEIARWEVKGGKRYLVLYHDAPFSRIKNTLDKGPFKPGVVTNAYSYAEFKGTSEGSSGVFYADSDGQAIAHLEANILKYFRIDFPSVKRVGGKPEMTKGHFGR